IPGSKQLLGRILNKEAEKVIEGMKLNVKNIFITGQCNGWKNIVKSSIVASMLSMLPKMAENLLEIVLGEIKYAMEVLKVKIMAWCTDAGGDSA
ncbi:hypothetical protein PAXRUDRAFT_77340, partial [Paxillus rubicundulus Ve08.2h10]